MILSAPITTDASGNAFATFPNVRGELRAVRVHSTGGSALDAGSVLSLSGGTTGITFINSWPCGTSKTIQPRAEVYEPGGSEAYYTADEYPVVDRIFIGGEDVIAALTLGGNTKSGTVYLVLS